MNNITLRDYQLKAVEAVLKAWKTHRSCVVVLPTGCGKTIVLAEVIRRRLMGTGCSGVQPLPANDGLVGDALRCVPPSQNRAIVLAHRNELIRQNADKINLVTGAKVGIEMGDEQVEDLTLLGRSPRVVVATIQTLITGRMHKFDPKDYVTLIVDEAHHATSKSYREVIAHFLENPNCRLLGVTATPDRADEKALGLVFEHVAYEYKVSDAIRDGWLVPVKEKLVTVGSLDFSGISTTAGDLNQGELAEVVEEERNLHAVAGPTIEICGNRRAIIFAVSVKQAERLAEIINRHVDGSAAWICGKTPKVERDRILESFRLGHIQFVVNVGVLTEGFDDAGVEVVVMARPTKSRALYAQMAGRATRPAAEIAAKLGEIGEPGPLGDRPLPVGGDHRAPRTAVGGDHRAPRTAVGGDHRAPRTAAAARRALIASSKKPECLIVDFVGNSGRHKLVTTMDILGGNFDEDDPDEAEARKLVHEKAQQSGEEIDTIAELEKARAEIKERKLVDAARRAFIQARAAYSVRSVDPFDVYDLAPVTPAERQKNYLKLSWKQKEILRNKMKVDPDTISSSEGRALLDEYFRRLKAGLATFSQARYLRRHGHPAPRKFEEASATITWLMRGAR